LFYSTKHKTVIIIIIIIIIIIYYIVIYNCRPAANFFLYAAANIVMYNIITRKRKDGSPKITHNGRFPKITPNNGHYEGYGNN